MTSSCHRGWCSFTAFTKCDPLPRLLRMQRLCLAKSNSLSLHQPPSTSKVVVLAFLILKSFQPIRNNCIPELSFCISLHSKHLKCALVANKELAFWSVCSTTIIRNYLITYDIHPMNQITPRVDFEQKKLQHRLCCVSMMTSSNENIFHVTGLL